VLRTSTARRDASGSRLRAAKAAAAAADGELRRQEERRAELVAELAAV